MSVGTAVVVMEGLAYTSLQWPGIYSPFSSCTFQLTFFFRKGSIQRLPASKQASHLTKTSPGTWQNSLLISAFSFQILFPNCCKQCGLFT